MKSNNNDFSEILKTDKCLIIAEVAQAHDGSLGTAHAYIDAIEKTGADAVKFQTHIAAAESTPDEPWRIKFSPQDKTRFEYWKRMEFSEEQWAGLKKHANERNLMFLSSAFSNEAFDLLNRIGVAAWKVASGEVTNTVMLNRMLKSGLSILLSTGMSPIDEIDRIVNKINQHGNDYAVLQCTSMYPAPPEKLGLNMLSIFKDRYNCPVGLSDHSGNIYAGLAAASLGASILEVHVTFSRDCFGPDVPASITTDELHQLVEGLKFINTALSNPVSKEDMAEELSPMRQLFTKSIVVNRDLEKGTILTEAMLSLKKPGDGLPPGKMNELIGKKLKVDLPKDTRVKENDLE